jgi:hypothetical protein
VRDLTPGVKKMQPLNRGCLELGVCQKDYWEEVL